MGKLISGYVIKNFKIIDTICDSDDRFDTTAWTFNLSQCAIEIFGCLGNTKPPTPYPNPDPTPYPSPEMPQNQFLMSEIAFCSFRGISGQLSSV